MRGNSTSLRGFTLLELLVVVAVIAILAGLLLTPLRRSKAAALKTVCVSNLRQVSLAVRMYADDSNDTTPGAAANPARDPFAAYKEYMKAYAGRQQAGSSSLFACPADKFHYDSNARVSQSLHQQPRNGHSSYAFNAGNAPSGVPSGAPPLHPWPGIAGWRLSSVQQPAKTLLVVEYPALLPYSWHQPGEKSHFNNAQDVVSYVDGHVSYIKLYWDTNNAVVGRQEAWHYDPPAGYDYKWSGD